MRLHAACGVFIVLATDVCRWSNHNHCILFRCNGTFAMSIVVAVIGINIIYPFKRPSIIIIIVESIIAFSYEKKTSSSIVEIQLHTKHKTSKTKQNKTYSTHTHTNELFLNWCHFKWLNPLRILIDLNWWVSSLDLLYFYLCSFTSFFRMPFFPHSIHS